MTLYMKRKENYIIYWWGNLMVLAFDDGKFSAVRTDFGSNFIDCELVNRELWQK